jgi:hypothetical protein
MDNYTKKKLEDDIIMTDKCENNIKLIRSYLTELYKKFDFKKDFTSANKFNFATDIPILSKNTLINDKLLNKQSNIKICTITINFDIFDIMNSKLIIYIPNHDHNYDSNFFVYGGIQTKFIELTDNKTITPKELISIINKYKIKMTSKTDNMNYNIVQLTEIIKTISSEPKKQATLKKFTKKMIDTFGNDYILDRYNIKDYKTKLVDNRIGVNFVIKELFNKLLIY